MLPTVLVDLILEFHDEFDTTRERADKENHQVSGMRAETVPQKET